MESLPRTEAPLPSAEPGTRGTLAADGGGDAPHLADPRALTILTTEHWSLLTARSLVYNESFSRGAMFLTFLSASLVALGFVYQAHSPDFAFVLIAILGLDLLVGLATLGRLTSASSEELAALQAMNRIRHAYLEMVPSLDPYFSTSRYDDAMSVLSAYGPNTNLGTFMNVIHGLTTMPGMIGMLDAALAGAVAASVAAAAGSDMRTALIAGLVVGLGVTLALIAYSIRVFGGVSAAFTARFPAPGAAAGDQPAGRRDT